VQQQTVAVGQQAAVVETWGWVDRQALLYCKSEEKGRISDEIYYLA
jgi:hypothetical protein